jgi:hypothetical protein
VGVALGYGTLRMSASDSVGHNRNSSGGAPLAQLWGGVDFGHKWWQATVRGGYDTFSAALHTDSCNYNDQAASCDSTPAIDRLALTGLFGQLGFAVRLGRLN